MFFLFRLLTTARQSDYLRALLQPLKSTIFNETISDIEINSIFEVITTQSLLPLKSLWLFWLFVSFDDFLFEIQSLDRLHTVMSSNEVRFFPWTKSSAATRRQLYAQLWKVFTTWFVSYTNFFQFSLLFIISPMWIWDSLKSNRILLIRTDSFLLMKEIRQLAYLCRDISPQHAKILNRIDSFNNNNNNVVSTSNENSIEIGKLISSSSLQSQKEETVPSTTSSVPSFQRIGTFCVISWIFLCLLWFCVCW